MNSGYDYRKFVYWIEEPLFSDVKTKIEARGISLRETKKAVCIPLSKSVQAGYVLPETWGRFELCKRQLSWYRSSSYYGKILLVSSHDLNDSAMSAEIIIRRSAFKPSSLPLTGEKARLIERLSYQNARPDEWNNIESQEIEEKERWLKVMGLRGVKFEDLFVSHSANHANFIEPVYFVLEGDERVPYSICKTSHVCSACMEWYNIIGGSFRKKLVVPCPGAVLFAGLVTNRYYEVTQCAST
ncbi:hypothetical protein [Desulfomonile tiedjei]|uniref:Uncharacterized protein n=1 Tax=Desulfomonile tiedjei (strain ATCC 49306 / DSM 6799 / DCB-1) TaxID=706587 RepID=I4CEE5_DESTA|nr:hypothetical protein [Desulfomonile tiedjei]AFM27936.1 hypothetical protein Desti_5347 [Desulfomonile tiedjei DSM 6799]